MLGLVAPVTPSFRLRHKYCLKFKANRGYKIVGRGGRGRTGNVSLRLGALTGLTEGLNSVPRFHVRQLKLP